MLDMLVQHFEPERQAQRWRQRRRRVDAAEAAAEAGQEERPPPPPLALGEIFVWLDVFALNQHPATSGQQGPDLASLREVVAAAEETLLVLDQEARPLSRVWCLYEAWLAGRAPRGTSAGADGGGEGGRSGGLEMTGNGKLRLLSYGISFERMKQAFIELDLSSAQSSVPEDRPRLLSAMCANCEHRAAGLRVAAAELRHALAGGAVAQVPGPEEEWTEATRMQVETAAVVCELCGWLEGAERLHRRSLECDTRLLGARHVSALTSAHNLSSLLRARDRLDEAEPLARLALDGRRGALGETHPDTLAAVHTLAGLLLSRGQHADAEALYRQALEAHRDHAASSSAASSSADAVAATADDGDGPTTSYSRVSAAVERRLGSSELRLMGNLARTLELQGRHDEAEALYRRTVEAQERSLGPNHPTTLASVSDLAALQRSRGRYAEAEELCRRALEGREQTLGPEHPDTMSCLADLACCLKEQGRHAEAESLARLALEGRERALGPQHHATLGSMQLLAGVLVAQGRHGEAAALFRRALGGLESTLGLGHPKTRECMSHLALVLEAEEQLDEAEALSRQVLDLIRRAMGPSHLDSLSSMQNLASLLAATGKTAEAESLYRSALGTLRELHGPDHDATLACCAGLAELLAAQGREAEAEALVRGAQDEALAAVMAATGGDPEDGGGNGIASGGGGDGGDAGEGGGEGTRLRSVGSLLRRAGELQAEGRPSEAEELCRRALEAAEQRRGAGASGGAGAGTQHPAAGEEVAALLALARSLHAQGRSAEAEPLLRRAVDGCRAEGLAERHAEMLAAVTLLAEVVLAAQGGGREGEAAALLAEAAEGLRGALGPHHAATLACSGRHASVLIMRGEHERAETLLRATLEGYETVYGRSHEETLCCVGRLAAAVAAQAAAAAAPQPSPKLHEAEALYRRLLGELEGGLSGGGGATVSDGEGSVTAQPPPPLAMWEALDGFARLLRVRGKYEEAERLLRRVLEGRIRALGEEHPDTEASRRALAEVTQALMLLARGEGPLRDAGATAAGGGDRANEEEAGHCVAAEPDGGEGKASQPKHKERQQRYPGNQVVPEPEPDERAKTGAGGGTAGAAAGERVPPAGGTGGGGLLGLLLCGCRNGKVHAD
ncbi:hypothetical protein GPECTOR_457g361 [Gonium pectorale]|uniref:MalT-like TPR region domain-containing protein n=1 Tax=Gonium pectorale TaxID=33097 RepID=A0A150FV29_GONPE|nr:hypothetical protein GPECTOR_457g361 [Gonium pectorale]|eukprot:KXZ41457.1 hypothetical protein GPECTOR_457g361 [Gonium pectorale]